MLADTKIEKDMKGLILRHTEFVIAVRQKILIYTFLEEELLLVASLCSQDNLISYYLFLLRLNFRPVMFVVFSYKQNFPNSMKIPFLELYIYVSDSQKYYLVLKQENAKALPLG